MYRILSKEERESLTENISELIEYVYICLSFSKGKTLDYISEDNVYLKNKINNRNILRRLLEIKGLLKNFKKYNFNNVINYVKKSHEIINHKRIPANLQDNFRKFTAISCWTNQFSKIWNSPIRTYLLASDQLEKVIVFRDKIKSDEPIKIKEWSEIEIKGPFSYYNGYNRFKGLKGHSVLSNNKKVNWKNLDYLDYNIQDVRQITNTSSFNYFVIDPISEQLSIFFNTPVRILMFKPLGSGLVMILAKDYYGYKHRLFIQNENLLNRYKEPPESIIKKYGSYFLLNCQMNINGRIQVYDFIPISGDEFAKRSFIALLRFRKIMKKKKNIKFDSPFIYEKNGFFYYIPKIFSDEKEQFYYYIKEDKNIAKFLRVLSSASLYFDINPLLLELYKGKLKFHDLHPPLIEKVPEGIKIKTPRRVLGHASVTLVVKNGVPLNIKGFIYKFEQIVLKEIPYLQIITNVEDKIGDIASVLSMIKNFKEMKDFSFISEKIVRVGDKKIFILKSKRDKTI